MRKLKKELTQFDSCPLRMDQVKRRAKGFAQAGN